MQGIRDDFAAANASGDGCLTKDEFKQFVITANQKGGAGESRETTDEWIDKAWIAFSEYDKSYEGCNCEDLIYVLGEIAK